VHTCYRCVIFPAVIQIGNRIGKVFDRLIELPAHSKKKEGGGEVVDGLVKIRSENQVGKFEGQKINFLVEGLAKSEVGEEGWELVRDGLVEEGAEYYVRNGER
jgi:hypothetical protein